MKMRVAGFAASLALSTSSAFAAARTLDIYFIDVEGGQATLLVTPAGESLLIDTGFAADGSLPPNPVDLEHARDANRIVAAARDAGLSQIDYVLITHFHPDHDGGVPELAKLIPVRTFIDHGDVAAEERDSATTMQALKAYAQVRSDMRHIEPRVGERLPLKGIEAVVVSSAATVIDKPLHVAASRNDACRSSTRPAPPTGENPRSTGVVISFGKFRFLDVGDLSGRPLFDLACPANLIGPVDVYLVAHHGGADVAEPVTFAAFQPRVAIMNNGVIKGGDLETFELLRSLPKIDVWQLHRSQRAGEKNFADDRVANPDESSAYWLRLSANADGSFRVLNARTGRSIDYPAVSAIGVGH